MILRILIPLLLFFATPASAYYNPGEPSGYVNDFALMLDYSSEQALEQKVQNFEKETSNEIAIVTIPSLQEDTIENFASQLFKEWGIGKKNKDNGVLILVARDDRQMRIEVGYGLEGALTDLQASWIINKVMKPEFKDGYYYLGLDTAVDKVMAATKGEYIPSESHPLLRWREDQAFRITAIIFFFSFFPLMYSLMFMSLKKKKIVAWSVVFGVAVILGFLLKMYIAGPLMGIAAGIIGFLLSRIQPSSSGSSYGGGSSSCTSSSSSSSSSSSDSSSSSFGGGSSGGGGASGSW